MAPVVGTVNVADMLNRHDGTRRRDQFERVRLAIDRSVNKNPYCMERSHTAINRKADALKLVPTMDCYYKPLQLRHNGIAFAKGGSTQSNL